MSEQPSPGYRWTTLSDPDALVVQLAPVPVVTDGGPREVMRLLLVSRGFRPVVKGDDLDLRASSGCLLTRTDDGAALLVTISETVGASRFALPGIDEEWWARAVALGHAAVLSVQTAVDGPDGPGSPDGPATTTRDDLLRDVDAGGVVAALVPVEDARAGGSSEQQPQDPVQL